MSELLTKEGALDYGIKNDLFEPFCALVKKRIYDAIFDISNLTSEEIDKPLKPDNTQQQETLQNRIQQVRQNQQRRRRRRPAQERASHIFSVFYAVWMVTIFVLPLLGMPSLLFLPGAGSRRLDYFDIIVGSFVSWGILTAPRFARNKIEKLLEVVIGYFNDVNATQIADSIVENVEVIIDEQTPLINAANQQRHSSPQDSSINQDSTSTVATNTQFTEGRQHNFRLFASSSQSGEEQKTENLAKCEPNEGENSDEFDGAPTIGM